MPPTSIRSVSAATAPGCTSIATFALAVFLILNAAAAASAQPAASRPPNIVVILADDLGYGDVASYNPDRGRIDTPHIDALARQGMRFTDAHAATAACSPSRYALLTGRYPWRTRLQQGIVGMWEPPLIDPDRLTIAGLAGRHGYRTICIGKWHLGWDWPIPAAQAALFRNLGGPSGGGRKVVVTPSTEHLAAWSEAFARRIDGGPTSRGFDTYFGTDVPNWPPFCFIEGDRTVGVPSTVLPSDQVTKTLATAQGPALPGWRLDAVLPALAARACDEITRRTADQRPFLLYLPLTAPHTPVVATSEWQGRSRLGHPYADFVMQADAVVGQVIAALDAAGVADETLVIFTSDNGCETKIGIEALEAKGHFPSGPFRGYKRDAWEGGHRVPFIVRWPGIVKPGSSCDQTVCSVDVMGTIADILGEALPANAGEDSVSLVPLLRGQESPVHEAVVHQSYQGVFAIRSGRWKLIMGPGSGMPDGSAPRLYDLLSDPGETTDVAGSHVAEVERLTAVLKQFVANGRSTAGTKQKNDVPVRIRKEGKRRKSETAAVPNER